MKSYTKTQLTEIKIRLGSAVNEKIRAFKQAHEYAADYSDCEKKEYILAGKAKVRPANELESLFETYRLDIYDVFTYPGIAAIERKNEKLSKKREAFELAIKQRMADIYDEIVFGDTDPLDGMKALEAFDG